MLVFEHVVKDGLETGASSSAYLHFAVGSMHGHDRAQLCIELTDINLNDTIAEDAIDAAVEVGQHRVGDASARVDGNQQAGVELSGAAHLQKACASIGTHTSQMTLAVEDGTMKPLPDEAVADTRLGAGFDSLDNFSR